MCEGYLKILISIHDNDLVSQCVAANTVRLTPLAYWSQEVG